MKRNRRKNRIERENCTFKKENNISLEDRIYIYIK